LAGITASSISQSFKVWVPSYSIQTGISSVEDSSLFSFVHTLVAFFVKLPLMCINFNTKKLLYTCYTGIIILTPICMGLYLEDLESFASLMIVSVIYALFFSNIYAATVALPSSYSFQLT
jgi:hypothetical protein